VTLERALELINAKTERSGPPPPAKKKSSASKAKKSNKKPLPAEV
jgi:topoisomerase IA-like protein